MTLAIDTCERCERLFPYPFYRREKREFLKFPLTLGPDLGMIRRITLYMHFRITLTTLPATRIYKNTLKPPMATLYTQPFHFVPGGRKTCCLLGILISLSPSTSFQVVRLWY